MRSVKEAVLLFASTTIILLIGINFGFEELSNPFVLSDSTLRLAEPLEGKLNEEFLERIIPAL